MHFLELLRLEAKEYKDEKHDFQKYYLGLLKTVINEKIPNEKLW